MEVNHLLLHRRLRGRHRRARESRTHAAVREDVLRRHLGLVRWLALLSEPPAGPQGWRWRCVNAVARRRPRAPLRARASSATHGRSTPPSRTVGLDSARWAREAGRVCLRWRVPRRASRILTLARGRGRPPLTTACRSRRRVSSRLAPLSSIDRSSCRRCTSSSTRRTCRRSGVRPTSSTQRSTRCSPASSTGRRVLSRGRSVSEYHAGFEFSSSRAARRCSSAPAIRRGALPSLPSSTASRRP